jgi:hypothetical protein
MRLKKLGVILIAVVALGAIAVGSASAAATTTAAKWYTGSTSPGTEVTTPQTITLGTKSGTTSTLESKIGKSLTPVKISSTSSSCSECKIENKEVTGNPGKVAYGHGSITFRGLTVSEPAHCKVAGGAVTSEPLVVHADFMNGTRAVQQFIPVAGLTEPFATFELENNGGTCAVAGLYAVTGTLFTTGVNNTNVFASAQEAEISAAIETANGGGLFIGSQPAVLTGTGVFSIGGLAGFAIH